MTNANEAEHVEVEPEMEASSSETTEDTTARDAKESSSFTDSPTPKERNVDALLNVKLDVRVVLGHNRLPVSDLLQLTRGSVIELDRKVGDPVDIMVNDRLIARGDLVKIEGDLVGVALREIVKDFVSTE